MAALSLDSSLVLYSIPAAWFTSYYPSVLKFLTIDKTTGYNNLQPRSNVAKTKENKNVPSEVADRIARMEAAHLNGNEAFPLWAAAALAAHVVGLDNRVVNKISLAFIGLRVLFNTVYINQRTVGQSWLRTGLWVAATSLPVTLLIKAANKVARS
ncbi:hypothetical protein CC1G_07635 [Coprinopsis cinerea okayama7|uniref:Membrane-associated proteins in eicosanoid and glutathione metabolism n=1 Tax=Coprinopsis cinerea (strain Okayama-7 / 130 / ATCC MYA-4618 / FGSC 9003) TaxID=240176 RepID=A8NC31_COPC7|nr:hypothetical protein CC1G_07635 [Coprinopsis cinerea okayama7\|eukprot:XP_001832375.2 hypothetical protein CC1G_07635 [Coprinopsis cinerea okayama7\